MKKQIVLSVLSKDRPGIVADITGVIFDLNGDLADLSQTVLDGYFSMIVMADEMVLGMINQKTTAVRLIPIPGKEAGEYVSFGGLFGASPVLPVRNVGKSSRFISWGGRIPAPVHSFRN